MALQVLEITWGKLVKDVKAASGLSELIAAHDRYLARLMQKAWCFAFFDCVCVCVCVRACSRVLLCASPPCLCLFVGVYLCSAGLLPRCTGSR